LKEAESITRDLRPLKHSKKEVLLTVSTAETVLTKKLLNLSLN